MIDFLQSYGLYLVISTALLIILAWSSKNKRATKKITQRAGDAGEYRINKMLLENLSPNDYYVLHDILLKTIYGGTTQIDHIVVSRYGIFVIETKNMSGEITGSRFSKYWKQKNRRGKRSFLNPLIQNKAHVKAIKNLFWFMWCTKRICHPVVIFAGSGKLAGRFPSNVLQKEELIPFILDKKEIVFSEAKTKKIFEKIKRKNIKGDEERKKHVRYVEGLKKI